MNKRNRWKAELPSAVITKLNELRDTKQRAEFQDYVVALRANGWSLSAIATPTGLSRERIRQLDEPIGVALAVTNTTNRGYDIPELPVKPVVEKVRANTPNPDPAVVSRLLELKPMAQKVRGKSQSYRAQGNEYSELIASEVARGVPAYRVAKSLGVTHSAIKFRLVRYGYSQSSSTAKVFRPIEYSN